MLLSFECLSGLLPFHESLIFLCTDIASFNNKNLFASVMLSTNQVPSLMPIFGFTSRLLAHIVLENRSYLISFYHYHVMKVRGPVTFAYYVMLPLFSCFFVPIPDFEVPTWQVLVLGTCVTLKLKVSARFLISPVDGLFSMNTIFKMLF